MAQHEVHSPIDSAIQDFKLGCLNHSSIKELGVDLTGFFAESKRLLSLFGGMVMGVLHQPERWTEIDIRQKNHRFIDDWESFFQRWLLLAEATDWSELGAFGVDIIHVNDHYETFLLDIFGLIYGPEAKEEIEGFLGENDSMIYYYEDGTIRDLRSPYNFAYYFKERYDKPNIKPSLN